MLILCGYKSLGRGDILGVLVEGNVIFLLSQSRCYKSFGNSLGTKFSIFLKPKLWYTFRRHDTMSWESYNWKINVLLRSWLGF